MAFGSITRRWMINSIGVVLLVLVAAVVIFAFAIANYHYGNMRASLTQRAQSDARFFNSYLNSSYSDYYTSARRYAEEFVDKNKLELQFLNTSGRVNVSSSGMMAGIMPETPDVSEAISTKKMSTWIGIDPATGERIMAVSNPLLFSNNQVVGVIRFVSSLKLVDGRVYSAVLVASLIAAIILAFIMISNRLFIRSIVNPVLEITAMAKRIAAGSYGAKITKRANDEIGELCDTINEISVEISNAEKMKSDFISSVSHELRTPLTAISGWGETVMYMDDTEEIKKGVGIMMKESTRLTALVEELLEFTMLESGRLKMRMSEIDIAAEFEEVVFVYIENFRKLGIALEYASDDDVPMIDGDRERLRQVFFNILDNAAKHGGSGGRIETSLRSIGSFVVILVRDFGHGIPPEDMPYIKQRFYKGVSQARGSGIGLAVANEIIELHQGELIITSEPEKGTNVVIRLPQTQDMKSK